MERKIDRIKGELQQMKSDKERINKLLDKRIQAAQAAIKRLEGDS